MSLSTVIKNISRLSKISRSLSLTIIPITCKSSENAFFVSGKTSIREIALYGLNFTFFFITIVQFFLNVFDNSKRSALGILFYGFVLVLTTGTGMYGVGYHTCASEFCCLLNVLVKYPYGLLHKIYPNLRPRSKRRQDVLLLAFILFVQITIAIIFLGFFPIMDITLAVTSPNCNINFLSFSKSLQSNIVFNLLIVLIKLPTYCTACLMAMLSTSIWLILIKVLMDNLKDLQKLPTKEGNSYYEQLCTFPAKYYSQIQVFAILINQCLQTYFWPVLEFLGAVVSIGLAYTFTRFHKLLNIYVQLSIVAALTMSMLLISVIFYVGSQPLLLSSKFLNSSDLVEEKLSQRILLRKIVKSYSPIVLKVGHFHKIDQMRGPTLIRFILQRTVFLLLKSGDMTAN